MARRKKQKKAGRGGAEGGKRGARLPVWKKAVFAAAAVAIALAVIEGALALAGVRPESYRSDPYVGFAGRSRLFVEERAADGTAVMRTARDRLEFFNAQEFPKEKAEGTFRIFSMGGSTTYGHPYTDETSFNGWLREYLKGLAPEKRWEVINAGGISYGSYRVARLMEEMAEYEPDLFVIYTGHNEFLERRAYRKIASVPGPLRAIAEAARHLRLTTVVKRAAAARAEARQEKERQKGLLGDVPVTILENSLGPQSYTRDAALRKQIFEHFRFNAGRMIDIAEAAGAKVIFVVPASNLREVSPFKSEHRAGLSEEEKARWRELYQKARKDYQAGLPGEALGALSEAAGIDDRPADLHFLRGRVLEKLGRYPDAKLAYERAIEEDVCPLRAPAAIGRILREATAARGVPLIDFPAMLEAKAPNGIPGGTLFLDHVHPTIEEYRGLALEILRVMEREGLAEPSKDEAAAARITESVLGRIDKEAHAFALMNLCKTLGWAGKREEALRAGLQAVELNPGSARIRYETGLAARLAGRVELAIEQYRAALELNPTDGETHCALGVALESAGDFEGAVRQFRLALEYGKPANRERDERNLEIALGKAGSSQFSTTQ